MPDMNHSPDPAPFPDRSFFPLAVPQAKTWLLCYPRSIGVPDFIDLMASAHAARIAAVPAEPEAVWERSSL